MTEALTSPGIITPLARSKEIITEVAKAHGLTFQDLFNKTHKRKISWARQEAIARLRTLKPKLSYPQIAEIFGGMHHTTCMYAERAHNARMAALVQSRAA